MLIGTHLINISLPNGVSPYDLSNDFEKMYKSAKRSAFWGNADAHYTMGCLLFLGRGVEKDEKKAFEHFLKAADKGHAIAQYNVFQFYRNGIGCTADQQKAVKYLTEAAKDGQTDAIYYYADALRTGDYEPTIAKNPVKALEYLKKAADKCDPDCANACCQMYEKGEGCPDNKPNYAEALKYGKIAAPKRRNAANRVGLYYHKGEIVTRDYKEAFKYFKMAADADLPVAISNVGNYYAWGYGVDKDLNKAVEYYVDALKKGYDSDIFSMLKVANINLYQDLDSQLNESSIRLLTGVADNYCFGGWKIKKDLDRAVKLYEALEIYDPYAASQLAQCYIEGLGVEKNYEKASYILHDAFIQARDWDPKYRDCFYQIGRCFYYGYGTEKNIEKAMLFWSHASEGGHRLASEWLAWGYNYGHGVAKDVNKGFEILRKLADDHYVNAYAELASAYEKGRGCERNYDKAFEYYSKSYDNRKDGFSAGGLAFAYMHGRGVKKDLDKAYMYAKLSAEKNNPGGWAALGLCYAHGYGVKQDYVEAFKAAQKAIELDPDYQTPKDLLQQLSAPDGRSLKPAADLDGIFKKAAGSVLSTVVGEVVGGLLSAGADD